MPAKAERVLTQSGQRTKHCSKHGVMLRQGQGCWICAQKQGGSVPGTLVASGTDNAPIGDPTQKQMR